MSNKYASQVVNINSTFSEYINKLNLVNLSLEWQGIAERSIEEKLDNCYINATKQSKYLTYFINALKYADLYKNEIDNANQLINTANNLDRTDANFTKNYSYYKGKIETSKKRINEYKESANSELSKIKSIPSTTHIISYTPTENFTEVVDQINSPINYNALASTGITNVGTITPGQSTLDIEETTTNGVITRPTDRIEGSSVIDFSAVGGNYKIVNTNTSVENYLSVIKNKGIKQSTSSKYNDMCLAVAYIHSYSMYSGNTSAGIKDSLDYKYASKFKGYTNDDKQVVLNRIYDEISAGKPVIVQVNGNKQGTSRHYVTVVGFNKNVASGSELKEEDLLIIDSYDGKIENMNSSTSRFMIPGSNTSHRKKYTGYQIYTIKENV